MPKANELSTISPEYLPDYETYRQIFIRYQQSLADAPPGVIPLKDLLDQDFRQVSSQCREAVVSF
jgi:hypothetical protein